MKAKALICCTVTAQLICIFVFAYAKSRFSHDASHLSHSTSSFFREKEIQEQTHVKTLDLLTLDRTAKEEKCDGRMEKEKCDGRMEKGEKCDGKMEKGDSEMSSAKYSELLCRGSLQNEVV